MTHQLIFNKVKLVKCVVNHYNMVAAGNNSSLAVNTERARTSKLLLNYIILRVISIYYLIKDNFKARKGSFRFFLLFFPQSKMGHI